MNSLTMAKMYLVYSKKHKKKVRGYMTKKKQSKSYW